jgi:hypothetical protein
MEYENMSDIITNLFSYVDLVWAVFVYAITWVTIVFQIILNPFLLIMVVLTLANIYVVLKSNIRSEIALNYGAFICGFARASYAIVIAILPVILSVITNIIRMLQGIMSSAPVNILGTGVSPGTVVAIAVIILFTLYSILSF